MFFINITMLSIYWIRFVLEWSVLIYKIDEFETKVIVLCFLLIIVVLEIKEILL